MDVVVAGVASCLTFVMIMSFETQIHPLTGAAIGAFNGFCIAEIVEWLMIWRQR